MTVLTANDGQMTATSKDAKRPPRLAAATCNGNRQDTLAWQGVALMGSALPTRVRLFPAVLRARGAMNGMNGFEWK
jgi:hypothetical protein